MSSWKKKKRGFEEYSCPEGIALQIGDIDKSGVIMSKVQGGMKCVKYLLFIFNFIFWVSPFHKRVANVYAFILPTYRLVLSSLVIFMCVFVRDGLSGFVFMCQCLSVLQCLHVKHT